jgi:hypothetical protein
MAMREERSVLRMEYEVLKAGRDVTQKVVMDGFDRDSALGVPGE